MKIVSILLFAFASHSAFADLNCVAHEILPGDAGRSGTIAMGDNPFSLRWDGDTSDLIGKGTLCGVALNATTVCETKDNSRGSLVAARMMCKDTAKSPFDNNVGEGYFAFDLGNKNGRFGCTNVSGRDHVQKIIEVSNCK